MRKPFQVITSCCAAFLLSLPAAAGNLGFLQSSVLREFTKEDAASFKATIKHSLDDIEDGNIVEWHSESSELSGKVLPKITYETSGLTCRRTLFLLADKAKRKGHYRFDICKIDSEWKIMDSPVAHFTKLEISELEVILHASLNGKSSGHPISWHNKKSGNSAVILALEPEGTDEICRKSAISLIAKSGTTSNGVYLFCKNIENQWKRRLSEH